MTYTTVYRDVNDLADLVVVAITTKISPKLHSKQNDSMYVNPHELLDSVRGAVLYCVSTGVQPSALMEHLRQLSEKLPPSPTPDEYVHPVSRFTITKDGVLLVDDDVRFCYTPSDDRKAEIISEFSSKITRLTEWMRQCRPDSDPVKGSTHADNNRWGREPALRGDLSRHVDILRLVLYYRTCRGVDDRGWFSKICDEVDVMCLPYYQDFDFEAACSGYVHASNFMHHDAAAAMAELAEQARILNLE